MGSEMCIRDSSKRWFSSIRRESAVVEDRGAFSGFERYLGHSGNIEGTADGFYRFLIRRMSDGLLFLLLACAYRPKWFRSQIYENVFHKLCDFHLE